MMYKIPYGQWLDYGISDDSSETEPFIDEDDSSETEPFIDEAQLLEDDKELGQKFHYVRSAYNHTKSCTTLMLPTTKG